MEIAVQLLSKIPEGWPRIVALLAVLAIYVLPMLRGQVSRRERQRPELEHLRLVLEVKKLAAEIEVIGQGRDLGDLSGADEVKRPLLSGFRPPSLLLLLVRQLLVIASGTAVAAFPTARWRRSFAYGLVLPFAVALVIVLSQGPGPQPVHPTG
jgi:hypothetical protein